MFETGTGLAEAGPFHSNANFLALFCFEIFFPGMAVHTGNGRWKCQAERLALIKSQPSLAFIFSSRLAWANMSGASPQKLKKKKISVTNLSSLSISGSLLKSSEKIL